ncbi:MAG: hypothetical protein V4501_08320 [Pseudomonadota bacterium]
MTPQLIVTYDINIWTLLTGVIALLSFVLWLGSEFERFKGLLGLPKQVEDLRGELSEARIQATNQTHLVTVEVGLVKDQVMNEIHSVKERVARIEAHIQAMPSRHLNG